MTRLQGMKQICEHFGRSENTMLELIRDQDFPATKIGGVWESDTDAINEWRREQVLAGFGIAPPPADAPAKRKKPRKQAARRF